MPCRSQQSNTLTLAPLHPEPHQPPGAQVADESRALFLCTARDLLSACGGYESKESRGCLMAAFPQPSAAAEWALALQLALLGVPWPPQLAALSVPAAAGNATGQAAACFDGPALGPQHSPSRLSPALRTVGAFTADALSQHAAAEVPPWSAGTPACPPRQPDAAPRFVFCGVRARVGLFSGAVDLVVPHGRSGRADYLGPPANRAARLMAAAQGGQVGAA
jgi:class 3 adenylate cyclase